MKNSMQILFKTKVSKKSNAINLKVRLFTSFMKKIYFQAIQDSPLSDSSSVFASIFVRRHRRKPPPPPLCCRLLPAQQSIAKWYRWTLSHHPLLLGVESSRHWGWRWTSARTCCRCTESPWRSRSPPGNAVRREEEGMEEKTGQREGFRLKSVKVHFRHFVFCCTKSRDSLKPVTELNSKLQSGDLDWTSSRLQ